MRTKKKKSEPSFIAQLGNRNTNLQRLKAEDRLSCLSTSDFLSFCSAQLVFNQRGQQVGGWGGLFSTSFQEVTVNEQ